MGGLAWEWVVLGRWPLAAGCTWVYYRCARCRISVEGNDVNRFGKLLPGLTVALVGLLSLAPAAKATDVFQTYDLAWSGSSLNGNAAIATGLITLDLTTLPDPESAYTDLISSFTSLTVTVSGSGAGDGTFTLANVAPDSDFGTFTY